MNIIKISLFIHSLCFFLNIACADEPISHAFEFRYFSTDTTANGETDFKGPTAIFTTEDRVKFLGKYADYASSFFGNPDLDQKAVPEEQLSKMLKEYKPQPLPSVRKRLLLKEWKWTACRANTLHNTNQIITPDLIGVSISDGHLNIETDQTITYDFPAQSWRFSFRWKAQAPATNQKISFILSNSDKTDGLVVGFDSQGKLFYKSTQGVSHAQKYSTGKWYEFKVEVDLSLNRYNLYIDDIKIADFVLLANQPEVINRFSVQALPGTQIDDIWGVGYFQNDSEQRPFGVQTILDLNFNQKPSMIDWTNENYNDNFWEKTTLPKVHGSERYAEEDLYFRKIVRVDEFEKAFLDIETLDPEGEVWINGRPVAVLPNRHPAKIDITKFLKKNSDNIVAVKVYHFFLEPELGEYMTHTPLDLNFGWFAGRIHLDLTSASYIDDVFVYTKDVQNPAKMKMKVKINHTGWKPCKGTAEVRFTPWFPEEKSSGVVQKSFPYEVGAGLKTFEWEMTIADPQLWTTDNPNLYKVEVVLKDDSSKVIDDFVLTTGIRKVSQEGGTFRVNGQPELLKGAQTFGFRPPFENLVTWCRSGPIEWLARELLMIRNMNGNLLRIHDHMWQSPAVSTNDPRIAELADQLGVMLIWATPAWIRTGKSWRQVDVEGYPKYMQQVYNHPSIVMWEATNHPQFLTFPEQSESDLACEVYYNMIYPQDPSRLISYTSYIANMYYGNDLGTIDFEGNSITPSPFWTAPMVVRGNQDSPTGYGREWSILRNMTTEYRSNLNDYLNSPDRAYFNFEHEESIGQPNWNLVKGKPWYKIQSYEWEYDKGSIGRRLTAEEWRESQAWQAFSAYESMRKQRWMDFDGFSWCCLHGGPNTATYKKPLIDFLGHGKLAYYANKMVFYDILGGSSDIDVVYGPNDVINPIILNVGNEHKVNLDVVVKNLDNKIVWKISFSDINLQAGRTVTKLEPIKPEFPIEGYYAIEYIVY